MSEDIKSDKVENNDTKGKDRMDITSNYCVCCGTEIPEGSLVCKICQAIADKSSCPEI